MIKKGEQVKFDAYLTDMSQTFDSTWNTENVFGRNDPIATFAGTQRTISLAFDVPAASREDAEKNLIKCGKIATYLYPAYNVRKHKQTKGEVQSKEGAADKPIETGKYMSRPPLVKIKFANIINGPGGGLLGFITSYSFNPVVEAGMFEFNKNFYPRTISLSIGFTVLHQTELGWVANSSGSVSRLGKIPFI